MRTAEIGVSVVSNKQGYFINVTYNSVPHTTYGPYPDPVTLPQALQIVAVTLKLD